MKTRLFYVLCLLAILTISSCNDVLEDLPVETIKYSPSYGTKYVDQKEAFDAYKCLMDGFRGHKPQTKAMMSIDYPDYFGGCYIGENNKLVVYIVGDSIQGRKSISQFVESNICFKSAKYSFKYLKQIMETINAYLLNGFDSSLIQNISVVSLMDKENAIVVKLYDCSEDEINKFKMNIVDSPAIRYEMQDKEIEPYSTVSPGSTITCNGTFSLGYRVKRMNVEGYITAAHGINENQFLNVGMSGDQFAYCTYRQWSGTVDAAFCESTYLADYSNIIEYTSIALNNTYGDIVTGAVISKSGYATKNTTGMIISSSSSIVDKTTGIRLTDVAAATVSSSEGDSGGIVYRSLGVDANPLGIIHGGDGATSYFIKATNIASALNCTLNN